MSRGKISVKRNAPLDPKALRYLFLQLDRGQDVALTGELLHCTLSHPIYECSCSTVIKISEV